MKIEELKNEKLKAIEEEYFSNHDWLMSPFAEFEEEFESLRCESSAFILVTITDHNKKDRYVKVENKALYSSLDSFADALPELIDSIEFYDSHLSFEYDGDGLKLYYAPNNSDSFVLRFISISCKVVVPNQEIQHGTNGKYEFHEGLSGQKSKKI